MFFMRELVIGLPGVIGVGPSCASIGFTERTSSATMASGFLNVVEVAAALAAKVELGLETYLGDDSYPMKRGVDRRGTIIRLSTSAAALANCYSPRHFNGGEGHYSLSNVTLDWARQPRGYTARGTQPSASNVSTLGSSFGYLSDIDVIDARAHGLDFCNTGELNGSGTRAYEYPESASRRIAGISSTNWSFTRIQIENSGDDAMTSHYSHSIDRHDVRCLNNASISDDTASMGAEVDDGSYDMTLSRFYVRGYPHVGAIKCHSDQPPLSNCHFRNFTGEMCGRGISFYSSAGLGVGDFGEGNSLDGFFYTRPLILTGQEQMALYVSDMEKNCCRNIQNRGRVGQTNYFRAINVSTGSTIDFCDGFADGTPQRERLLTLYMGRVMAFKNVARAAEMLRV